MKYLLVLAIAGAIVACNSPTGPTPPGGGGGGGGGGNPPTGRTVTFVGAGDIGECGFAGAQLTGRIIQATPGEVFLAGDIAYYQGTRENFAQCFDPFWGHARDRWYPAPGNHEYQSPGAFGYFEYFGAAAGPGQLGYYRAILGDWLVLMLNSASIPPARGSLQYEFVREALESRPTRCALAIWHHPRFSSGPNGPSLFMQDLWELLYEHNVDLVVNGHDHLYERFSRQDPAGRPDGDRGIRQITVGTGGANLVQFVRVAPNSAARLSVWGVLKLTLAPDRYEWQFLDVNGNIGDQGFTLCH